MEQGFTNRSCKERTSVKHRFYVDLAGDYQYNWDSPDDTSTMVLSREFGYEFRFVCNSYAKISKGDVYQVVVDSPKDELFFFIKTGFEKIDSKIVEEYISLRHRSKYDEFLRG